jgi:hypothetical protein
MNWMDTFQLKKYKWPKKNYMRKMFNIFSHQGSANQNYIDSTSSQSEWLSSRKQRQVLAREKGTLTHCWWECKLVQLQGKSVWRFLKKLEIELPYVPAIPPLGVYLKESKSAYYRDTAIPILVTALFIIAKLWNQPLCLLTNE